MSKRNRPRSRRRIKAGKLYLGRRMAYWARLSRYFQARLDGGTISLGDQIHPIQVSADDFREALLEVQRTVGAVFTVPAEMLTPRALRPLTWDTVFNRVIDNPPRVLVDVSIPSG